MTIKWVILRLEREHRKIRRQVWESRDTGSNGVSEFKGLTGVDYGAVARSSELWQMNAAKCNIIRDGNNSWLPAQEVH